MKSAYCKQNLEYFLVGHFPSFKSNIFKFDTENITLFR